MKKLNVEKVKEVKELIVENDVGDTPIQSKIPLRSQLKYIDGKWIRVGPD